MEFKEINKEIDRLEWLKKDDSLTENGEGLLKELKEALSVCELAEFKKASGIIRKGRKLII